MIVEAFRMPHIRMEHQLGVICDGLEGEGSFPMESISGYVGADITRHNQLRNAKQSVLGSQISRIRAITGLLLWVVGKEHATGCSKRPNSKTGSGLVLPVLYVFAGIVSLPSYRSHRFDSLSNNCRL